jgi:uncharacterized protein (DUF952 family)
MSQSEFDHQPADEPVIESSLADEGLIDVSATAEQVTWVANRLYGDVVDLVVLVLDEHLLTAPVRYDSTPDGVFPHLYGPLDREAIVDIQPLQREVADRYIFSHEDDYLTR